jgi:MFS family permease
MSREATIQGTVDPAAACAHAQAAVDVAAVSPPLIPRLPRAAWVVLAGDALSAIGSGMTLPFLLVYLHAVLNLSLSAAGLAVATVALASFAGNPLGGWLADRFGPRAALVAGLATGAAGAIALVLVAEPWHAFAATATIGLGASVAWPAQDALLASVAGPEQRSAVFSVRHATLNAGLAIGALAAAAIVDAGDPRSFTILYLADAATFLVFIPVLLRLAPPPAADHPPRESGSSGLRSVLRDRAFVRVWVLCAVVVAVSYGQLHAAFPAFATRPGGIPMSALGLAYAANAIVVVAAQLVVLRLLRGRRRTTAISLACLTFAAAWACTLAAGMLGAGAAAAIAFAAALAVFGLAETLLAPTFAAIVNDLAPDELRGRYNGLSTLAWTTGFLLGPALAGVAIDAGAGSALFAILIAAGCAAALAARRVGRHLRPGANLVEAC